MTLRTFGIGVLIVIAVGLTGWWLLRTPVLVSTLSLADAPVHPPRNAPVPPVPAPTSRERARFDPAAFEVDKKAQIEAMFAEIDRQPPFPVRVEAALRRAEAGDVDAAAELGRLLAQCASVLLDPEARKIAADWQDELAHIEELRRSDPKAAENALFNRRQDHERDTSHHAECIAVGLPLLADYHVWLERAARGGSIDAMRRYAESAFDDFADQNAMLADLDEVIRRRDLARTFLRQAFERGDVASIAMLASSHDWDPWAGQRAYTDTGGLLPPDRLQAQTYWYLDALARSAYYGQGDVPFDRLWSEGPERHDYADLDEVQWQAVANAARALYLRHFTDPPPPPG